MLQKLKIKAMAWVIQGAWEGDGLRRKATARLIATKIMEVKIMRSWQTTVFGLLGAVGAYLVTVKDPVWMQNVGGIIAAIGTAGLGLCARDNNKSSEAVGAKDSEIKG